jgi:hypothetical protein
LPAVLASAFQLVRQSDGALPALNAAVDNSGPGTVVTLTFTSTNAVDFGSLADGRYTLSVLANQINTGNFDGNGDGVYGDNYTLVGDPAIAPNLFRLFGDSNGDGIVAANDFIQFRVSFNTANSAFDFDNNGMVDASDFIQFRLRFGGSI